MNDKFLSLLIASVAYFDYPSVDPDLRPRGSVLLGEYDFIIVGAGSAGSVVANRLTEIADWTVLLIEAGRDEDALTDTPILALAPQLDHNWNFSTTKQNGVCLSTGGKCPLARGRSLGGSSVINYMVYARGNKKDYNQWAVENPGWSYEQVLPYFKLSEDNRNPKYLQSGFHGSNGYLTVSEAPYHTQMADRYIKAGLEMNYQNGDLNGRNQTGFMILQGTLRNGSRCSTSKAFLRPVRNRRNLAISENSHVTKLITNGGHASSVVFIKDNTEYEVRAKKEIILSAGAINTPQILMLSGIGPSEDLKKLGIEVKKDLKVGFNLQDHVGTLLTFSTNTTTISNQDVHNVTNILNYAQPSGSGPLTVPVGLEAIAFVNINEEDPDIEIHFSSYSLSGNNVWVGNPLLLNPDSKGRVSIKSKDPFEQPLINPNYFSFRSDYKRVIQGMKFLHKLSQTKSLQMINSRLTFEPPCLQTDLDQFFACVLDTYTATVSHPVGTCKMGKGHDAVVDSNLKLYGFDNLRVIDGSIMPTIVRGNVNAPIIMIGEKGSDIIKTTYGQKPQIGQEKLSKR